MFKTPKSTPRQTGPKPRSTVARVRVTSEPILNTGATHEPRLV